MKRTGLKTVITAVTLIAIFILFLTGTYSKYSFAGHGEIKKESAKWDVKITSENNDLTIEETHNIDFKVEDNPYVVKNKMAPGCKAVANMEINLEGTETAVDVYIDVDKRKLPSENFKVITKIDGEILKDNTKVIELESNQAFTSENGKKILSIELIWEDKDSENLQDTVIGIQEEKIELPVTVIAEQHI